MGGFTDKTRKKQNQTSCIEPEKRIALCSFSFTENNSA